jgi:ribosomal protein S18 acetylase RimI-like enzyme
MRRATTADLPFLELMLVEATNWDGLRGTTRASVEQDSSAWRYLEGWPRATDFGIVAIDGAVAVGAGWARFLLHGDAGYGYVDDAIPELTLAVAEEARGRGVGTDVLGGLIESARGLVLPGLSLSVEDGNAGARKLYEKAGFTVVGRNGNSDTMLLRLHP